MCLKWLDVFKSGYVIKSGECLKVVLCGKRWFYGFYVFKSGFMLLKVAKSGFMCLKVGLCG